MNAVKVQYTVKEAYVETNKANIQRVMADLKEIGRPTRLSERATMLTRNQA